MNWIHVQISASKSKFYGDTLQYSMLLEFFIGGEAKETQSCNNEQEGEICSSQRTALKTPDNGMLRCRKISDEFLKDKSKLCCPISKWEYDVWSSSYSIKLLVWKVLHYCVQFAMSSHGEKIQKKKLWLVV